MPEHASAPAHPASAAHAHGAVRTATPTCQAYQILHVAFTIAPLIAGADKFFHLLVNWDQYLSPTLARMLPVAPHTFMLGVGVIEIVAALIVAVYPMLGGWIVGLWLLGIIGNLLTIPAYFDIALRDFGLALGAFALARLAGEFERH